jgi:hypothetical protein
MVPRTIHNTGILKTISPKKDQRLSLFHYYPKSGETRFSRSEFRYFQPNSRSNEDEVSISTPSAGQNLEKLDGLERYRHFFG